MRALINISYNDIILIQARVYKQWSNICQKIKIKKITIKQLCKAV